MIGDMGHSFMTTSFYDMFMGTLTLVLAIIAAVALMVPLALFQMWCESTSNADSKRPATSSQSFAGLSPKAQRRTGLRERELTSVPSGVNAVD